MEFSFEYYDWLRKLNDASPVLIFISIFGAVGFLLAFGIARWMLKMIGLIFLSEWKFLDDFMICTFLTGFFGGFLIMIFTFLFETSGDNMPAIRLLFIWTALYICVLVFYMTNRTVLVKWYHDMTASSSKSINTSGKVKDETKKVKKKNIKSNNGKHRAKRKE